MSVYAYGLSLGAPVVFRNWFEYTPGLRFLHALYWRLMRNLHNPLSVWVWTNWKLLPPSRALGEKWAGKKTLYFFGWLFRNPVGFEQYRKELLTQFGASEHEQATIEKTLSGNADKTRIGVYIRLRPLRFFPNGDYLISLARTESVVAEYLERHSLTKDDVVLVIVTDTTLPRDAFPSYTSCELSGDTRKNLLLLASCNMVIGTNAMFPNLAAWFGNVPHIVTTDEPIDWDYYTHTQYFENKYVTFAFGSTEEAR